MYDTVYPRVHQAQKNINQKRRKEQGTRHKVQGKSIIRPVLHFTLRLGPLAVLKYRLSANSHPGSPKTDLNLRRKGKCALGA
jgi:hypothetical protein